MGCFVIESLAYGIYPQVFAGDEAAAEERARERSLQDWHSAVILWQAYAGERIEVAVYRNGRRYPVSEPAGATK